MNLEEQLREYRSTLDVATEAARSEHAPLAPVIRMRPIRTIAVAVVTVAAAIAIAFAFVGTGGKRSTPPAGVTTTPASTSTAPTSPAGTGPVVMPSVIGTTQSQATLELTRMGFVVKLTSVGCTAVAPDHVVAQQPLPMVKVARGSNVTIEVCGASQPIRLTVTECATVEGVSGGVGTPPKTVVVPPPTALGDPLGAFADKQGRLVVIAPASSTCAAVDAADGSASIEIPADNGTESGSSFNPASPSDHEGLFAISTPTCQGCAYAEICGIVPNADAQVPGFDGTCAARPHGETITPMGDNTYRIDDPAGTVAPDEAISFLRFRPRTASTDPSFVRATCAFPDQLDICASLLNEFLAANP